MNESQKSKTVTPGMHRAIGRKGDGPACPSCGYKLPAYPGRYPRVCPSCGEPLSLGGPTVTAESLVNEVLSGRSPKEVAGSALEEAHYIHIPDGHPLQDTFLHLPESGMGYQSVDVHVQGGEVIKDCAVINASTIKVPERFGEVKADDIEKVVPVQ